MFDPEKKKALMKWPKGDLAERLLFAYETIKRLESNTQAEALKEAADRAEAEIEEQGMEEVVSVARLRKAIIADKE